MALFIIVITQKSSFLFSSQPSPLPRVLMARILSKLYENPGWSLADGGWELGVGEPVFGCGHFFIKKKNFADSTN